MKLAKHVAEKRKHTSLLQYYPPLTKAFKHERDKKSPRVLLDQSCKDAEKALQREGFLPIEHELHKDLVSEKILTNFKHYVPKRENDNDFELSEEESSSDDESSDEDDDDNDEYHDDDDEMERDEGDEIDNDDTREEEDQKKRKSQEDEGSLLKKKKKTH